jgi:hypothetical protein
MRILWLLTACSEPVAIDDVVITGAPSDALERRVREALEDQAASYDPWPLDLREIRLTPAEGGDPYTAQWVPGPRRVDLGLAWFQDTVSGPEVLALTVCEAMHEQRGLGLWGRPRFPNWDPTEPPSRDQRYLLYQHLCSRGVEVAVMHASAAAACGQPELADAAHQVLDALFTGAPAVPAPVASAERLGDVQLAPGERLELVGTRSADVIVLSLRTPEGDRFVLGADADGALVEDPGVTTDTISRDTADVYASYQRTIVNRNLTPRRVAIGAAVPDTYAYAAGFAPTDAGWAPLTGVCGEVLLGTASESGFWFVAQTGDTLTWWRLPAVITQPDSRQ